MGSTGAVVNSSGTKASCSGDGRTKSPGIKAVQGCLVTRLAFRRHFHIQELHLSHRSASTGALPVEAHPEYLERALRIENADRASEAALTDIGTGDDGFANVGD